MGITEKDIEKIVKQVICNITSVEREVNNIKVEKMKEVNLFTSTINQENKLIKSDYGVFENMEDAINEADLAQKELIKNFSLEDRERFISEIRKVVLEEKVNLARMIFKETKLGRVEDKIKKLELTAMKTPGTEDLKTEAFSGKNGLTIVEQGPFGLIGAVTPVTNPVESIINNSIGIIASGNSVVFNVHPSSKNCCSYIVKLINKTIESVGGPKNIITMVKNPTMDTIKELTTNQKVRMLLGTGGPGLIKTLLESGKKVIGAGAGNPPVIVDETANIEYAAKSIIEGASFDNNILCIAEKEVFVIDKVADELIFNMLNNGAYMLSKYELEKIMSFAIGENVNKVACGCSLDTNREYHVAKDWVGKNSTDFLDKIGVPHNNDIKLLICEVEFEHPYVQLEQMMPVLPIVRVRNIEEAIELAVKAEHGNRHTAIMHSTNINNLTQFAKAIETTIFVKNAPSLAGVGANGEGYTTMSIAGPTGEGLTSAKSFTRKRRCVLAEGGFRIV